MRPIPVLVAHVSGWRARLSGMRLSVYRGFLVVFATAALGMAMFGVATGQPAQSLLAEMVALLTGGVLWWNDDTPARKRRRRVKEGQVTLLDVNDIIRARNFAAERDGGSYLPWDQLSVLTQSLKVPDRDLVGGRVVNRRDGGSVPTTTTAYRWVKQNEDPTLLVQAVACGFSDEDLSGFIDGGHDERAAFEWLVALAVPAPTAT